jgi:hypothetical protein
MFAGFTDRLNFGLGGGTVSVPSAFPTRPIGQLGNFNTYAINFILASGITASDQQSAINQLSTDLVNTGLMNKMFAIYPFVGGTAETHKWNLKDPRDTDNAFRLTFFGGATHSGAGYQSSISNGYANTYLIPASVLPATNNHLSVYNRSTVVGSNSRGNIATANTTNVFNQLFSGASFFGGNGTTNQGGVSFTTTGTVQGYWIGSKTSNSQRFGFRNGVLNSVVTTTTDNTLNYTLPFFINARNSAGTANLFSGHEISFATIGVGLTQEECATLYTIVQRFQTTLGRQV